MRRPPHAAIIAFVDDDLANWYVRLNRSRFYDVVHEDNRAAFATLHEVLVSVCRLLAPFAPFVSDWVHRELTGESVHLAPYVTELPIAADLELEAAMDAIRTLARLGRAAREEIGIKVRQPLGRLVCVAPRVGEGGVGAVWSLFGSGAQRQGRRVRSVGRRFGDA
jgi:isoleucyl-tRNA synthetase